MHPTHVRRANVRTCELELVSNPCDCAIAPADGVNILHGPAVGCLDVLVPDHGRPDDEAVGCEACEETDAWDRPEEIREPDDEDQDSRVDERIRPGGKALYCR